MKTKRTKIWLSLSARINEFWKKIILMGILFLPFISNATVYTSIKAGDWNTPSTWSPAGVPTSYYSDTAIINTDVVIGIGYAGASKVTINPGGTLENYKGLTVLNSFTNNGSFAGNIRIAIYNDGATVSGTGSYFWFTSQIDFMGQRQTITSGTVIKLSNGIILETAYLRRPVSVINNGSVTVIRETVWNDGTQPASWTQGPNSFLQIDEKAAFPFLSHSYDTLRASAFNNIIVYTGLDCTIKKPVGSTYYHLTLYTSGHTCTFPSDLIVLGTFDNGETIADFAGHNLTLGGSWLNNTNGIGTYKNMGLVTFNGSSTQYIEGNNPTRFNNFTVAGSGGVSIITSGSFTGVLSLGGNGLLSGPGVDTMIATATTSAVVAKIPNGATITANFVIQCYDGRTAVQYQTLSSPVQSTTLGDWNLSNRTPPFFMKGVGGPDGDSGTYCSVKLYNEVTNAYDNITNYASPGINYVLKQGQGIYLLMAHSGSSMWPFTFITHGIPTQGNVNYNVTRTVGKGNGFNLIGNPYPSPISWKSLKNGNNNLQNSFYIFGQDGSWHAYTKGNIAIGQGFGVYTNSSTTITFKEQYKVNTDTALMRMVSPDEDQNAATFVLSNDVNSYSCPATVSFGSNYVPEYNSDEDAIFMSSFINEVPQLYTYSADKVNLTINNLPDADNLDVPLVAIGNVAANYTLSTKNIRNISSYNSVTLVDKNTGEVLNNFEINPAYTFSISQAGQEKDFILQFRKMAPEATAIADIGNDNMQIYSTARGAVINFHMAKPVDAIVSVYDLTGQKVVAGIHVQAYENQLNIALPGSVTIYIIRVETPQGVTVKKLYNNGLGY